MPLYKFSNEQLNYFKFATIVLDEFPKALQQAFVFMWDNKYGGPPTNMMWDDSVAVRNQLCAQEHKNPKIPTHLPHTNWDCTALFQATLYAHSFKSPDAHGHLKTLNDMYIKPLGLVPSGVFHATVSSSTGNQDETFALALDQLRRLRNMTYHSKTESMDKAAFDHCLKLVKECFSEQGLDTGMIDNIAMLKEEEFTADKYLEMNEQLHKEKSTINQFLKDQVLEEVTKLREVSHGYQADVEHMLFGIIDYHDSPNKAAGHTGEGGIIAHNVFPENFVHVLKTTTRWGIKIISNLKAKCKQHGDPKWEDLLQIFPGATIEERPSSVVIKYPEKHFSCLNLFEVIPTMDPQRMLVGRIYKEYDTLMDCLHHVEGDEIELPVWISSRDPNRDVLNEEERQPNLSRSNKTNCEGDKIALSPVFTFSRDPQKDTREERILKIFAVLDKISNLEVSVLTHDLQSKLWQDITDVCPSAKCTVYPLDVVMEIPNGSIGSDTKLVVVGIIPREGAKKTSAEQSGPYNVETNCGTKNSRIENREVVLSGSQKIKDLRITYNGLRKIILSHSAFMKDSQWKLKVKYKQCEHPDMDWKDLMEVFPGASLEEQATSVIVYLSPEDISDGTFMVVGSGCPKSFKRMQVVAFGTKPTLRDGCKINVYVIDDDQNVLKVLYEREKEKGHCVLSQPRLILVADIEKAIELSLQFRNSGWKLMDSPSQTLDSERAWRFREHFPNLERCSWTVKQEDKTERHLRCTIFVTQGERSTFLPIHEYLEEEEELQLNMAELKEDGKEELVYHKKCNMFVEQQKAQELTPTPQQIFPRKELPFVDRENNRIFSAQSGASLFSPSVV